MRKEAVLEVADFRFVSIECRECGTVVTLDMAKRSDLAAKHNFFAPLKCPGCHRDYDSSVPSSVDALQRVYEELQRAGGWLSFRGLAMPVSGKEE